MRDGPELLLIAGAMMSGIYGAVRRFAKKRKLKKKVAYC